LSLYSQIPHTRRQDGPGSVYDSVWSRIVIWDNRADRNSVDNSEASRNGDYVPSRWEAQQDAVNLIFSAKTGANPESSVGLMSMGGSTPEILTTLTTDIGKILDGLHRTKIKGSSHFVTGINVAAVGQLNILGPATLTRQHSWHSSTGRTSHRSRG
jgi:hypothetical protein